MGTILEKFSGPNYSLHADFTSQVRAENSCDSLIVDSRLPGVPRHLLSPMESGLRIEG